jgi:hypothetical protein
MLAAMRRLALVCAIGAMVGCSSSGSSGGDGSAMGGAGGGGDVTGPCTAPLSENTVCAPSFDMQVATNPCDPTDMATQAMCGKYKVWSLVVVGSDTCVYDPTNNGKLVGARSCGGAPAECVQGCITSGIAASLYATCGAETPACPP